MQDILEDKLLKQYCVNYRCKYNLDIIEKIDDDDDDEDEESTRDIHYKTDLISIFGVGLDEEFSKIEDILDKVYELVKMHERFKNCMSKTALFFMSTDERVGLSALFCYDYMYATHACISEYIIHQHISEENIKHLEELLKIQ